MTTKVCRKCKVEYPRSTEYFFRDSRARDGLLSCCKPCMAEYKRQYYRKNKQSIAEYNNRYRIANRERLAKAQKEWNRNNADHKRQWHKNNHKKVAAQHKLWNEAHPGKMAEYKYEYYLRNREKIACRRRETREHTNEMRRQRYKRNERLRDYCRAARQLRRARKLEAEGSFTTKDMRHQYKAQKGKCWWCSRPIAWEEHHNDHLIPLSRGGTNWPNNMVVSCAQCNLSKNNKLPEEWAGKLF